MRAMDIMTSEVITVREDATVPEAAKLMAERGISAVPVVDKENRVIGMVSEEDLLHRAETGTERRRSWWLDMVSSTNKLAGEYIKSHGEDISLTWFDIGMPLLIHTQPNQIPNRRYGVCTLLIPALGTRLVRNGIEAKGQSWPREREGRPFSTSALAFSESWTDAV